MPVSQSYLVMLREFLAPFGHITTRRMFGGASIYCDGVLFALADEDVLYFKADATTKARYEGEGLGPFTYQGQTGPVQMSYWRVPERLYDEADEMVEWAREAIGVAQNRKTSMKPKKSGAKKMALPNKPKPQARKS